MIRQAVHESPINIKRRRARLRQINLWKDYGCPPTSRQTYSPFRRALSRGDRPIDCSDAGEMKQAEQRILAQRAALGADA